MAEKDGKGRTPSLSLPPATINVLRSEDPKFVEGQIDQQQMDEADGVEKGGKF